MPVLSYDDAARRARNERVAAIVQGNSPSPWRARLRGFLAGVTRDQLDQATDPIASTMQMGLPVGPKVGKVALDAAKAPLNAVARRGQESGATRALFDLVEDLGGRTRETPLPTGTLPRERLPVQVSPTPSTPTPRPRTAEPFLAPKPPTTRDVAAGASPSSASEAMQALREVARAVRQDAPKFELPKQTFKLRAQNAPPPKARKLF